jgi:diguanylate cyclase (GGDEF)-like protein/PAS domain S-box-containing protein
MINKTTATLLIVEDEIIVAQDLQFILEELGYSVPEIADSSESAIEKTARIKPDLILMDVRIIGEMDGIDTAKIISERFEIPVIYMTAHSDEATLARAKETAPFGYIIKPFEERELQTTIEIALYKHKMEKRLKENAQWLTTVLRSIGDGVIATDRLGRISFLNPVAEKITGWSLSEAVGKDSAKVFQLIDEDSRKPIDHLIAQVLKTGKGTSLPENTLLIAKDGKEIPVEDSISPIELYKGATPIEDSNGSVIGAVVVFRDVTEQRLAAKKLHRKAFYDDLTNLPNRVWFKERVTDAIARLQRNPNYLFAVLVLDLDRFKNLNDSLGHAIGDLLLFHVAQKLLHSVRSIDTVARLGGDEFAILLENLQNYSEVDKIVQRIQQDLKELFNLEGQEVYTDASIGIVLSSISYFCVEDMLRDADIAMYRAKNKGRGRYEIFNTAMRDRFIASSQIEKDLRTAIERGELTVYYQPIVSLSTQQTEGFEALVRWHHPQRGIVSPAEFVPIAEETGLIVRLDSWVLQEACRQMKTWQEQYPDLSHFNVSVNLSSLQFRLPNLIDKISKILDETGLESNHLKLEITESAFIENPELAAIILEQLRELGVGLSLDDFGTGYSSLSNLYRFPVNTLKIDRSFINRIDRQREGLEIVRIIVMLGQTLGMDVVAEGIETEAQLALLQQLHCQCGQGYFFSKPLPADQASAWIKSRFEAVSSATI